MLESVTTVALTSALDGLSARQRAIADNIANVNTPHYKAKVVSFEDRLRASVAAQDGRAEYTTTESLDPTRLDGNNVNIDQQTLLNVQAVLAYQFASQAVGGAFKGVQTAMRTS